jgi:hypothetical protein
MNFSRPVNLRHADAVDAGNLASMETADVYERLVTSRDGLSTNEAKAAAIAVEVLANCPCLCAASGVGISSFATSADTLARTCLLRSFGLAGRRSSKTGRAFEANAT